MKTPPPRDLRFVLSQEHLRLGQLIAHVTQARADNDRSRLTALWTEFQTALEAHFSLEEQEIFPQFIVVDAKEVEDLMAEHQHMRHLAETARQNLDAGGADTGALDALLQALATHLDREKAVLYLWADKNLRDALLQAVRRRA